MKAQWVRLGGAALILGSAMIACNSDRVAGTGAAAPALKKMKAPPPTASTTPDTVTVVSRRVPLVTDITVTKTIDSRGGTLDMPEAGFRLVVPANAVSRATPFTVTAFKGRLLAYEFGPTGSRFDSIPLRAEQNLTVLVIPDDVSASVGYFADRSQLQDNGTVGNLEEPLRAVFEDVTGTTAIFSIYHFSGYVLASGRKR